MSFPLPYGYNLLILNDLLCFENIKVEESRQMLHGTFKGTDKDSKANDSKNIILLSIVKSGAKKIGCVCVHIEVTLVGKSLCIRHYSCPECTYILSFNSQNHSLRKYDYKKQILKEKCRLSCGGRVCGTRNC